jgi:hypothetical protein
MTIGGVIAIVLLVSLGGSIVLTDFAQPWAFFTLPARAWELAMGGLLALVVQRTDRLPARLGGRLVAAGLALIVTSGVVLSEATPFPGTAALLPTLGTALVIAGGNAGSRTIAARLLQLPPVRYIGRISYSLYLWHWPILVLPAAAAGRGLPTAVRIGLVGISILVAAASQRWIEEPIRRGRFVGRSVRRSLGLAGATSLVVASTALATGSLAIGQLPAAPAADVGAPSMAPPTALPPDPLVSLGPATPGATRPGATDAPPSRPPLVAAPVPDDLLPPLREARETLARIYADDCHLHQLEVELRGDCVYGDPGSPMTVVLFGDSHAAQWFPALEAIAVVEGWRLVPFTKSACSGVDVERWNLNFGRPYTECAAWLERVYAWIARERPDIVITATSRGYTIIDGGVPVKATDRPEEWAAGYARMLTRLSTAAGQVVVIADTPRSAVDPPVCLSAHLDNAAACATPVDVAIDAAAHRREAEMALAGGASFIDPGPWVCPTDPCPAVVGRYLVYRDAGHLAPHFAAALARRLLAALPIP